ncbi:MAG: rod shape-determining protein MreD [Paracoccaceae bacterium]|jgi:rod shape-determining protein MreD
MVESPTTRVWIGRALFVGLTFAIIFVRLLPLETLPRSFGFPDAMLCLALTWTVRRPDYVPALLIAALFLLADMLFHRPPGLWTALVLVLTETLRARSSGLRSMHFTAEWATVAAGIVVITLVYSASLTVVMVARPPLSLALTQMVTTILFYPIVVGLSHVIFGVSRPPVGAVDPRGHRL